ncbi:hypothetical protein EST62_01835 [Chlorobaculum sp. 24CR]|uniref:hypothetical protein n=1 Tax=Chlorobaculum sp. 24CR TaxID=2508878 RepID=UPI00100ACEF8|nr:hypothetical protein [Chlorobaculum sp. 24CR]RXK88630.1 hypothetical protein EST62_01835 [Chlorobaculum sp. 24CR]
MSNAITNFKTWFDSIGDLEYDDVHSLHVAVSDESSCGIFDVSKKNNSIFISLPTCDEILRIASPDAKKYFLSALMQRFCEGNMSIELWYMEKKELAKKD